MSLALGIDYSLFILTRYREEREQERTIGAAIIAAEATSGRAVVFSGTAVVLALAGMLIVPDTVLRSLGIGAILATAVSVLAALTLLPAVLALVGDRVNALAVPFLHRSQHRAGEDGGFWSAVARVVMRHPTVALVASVAFLLTLAIPGLGLNTGSSGISTLPDSAPSKQGFELLQRSFPGGQASPAKDRGGRQRSPA